MSALNLIYLEIARSAGVNSMTNCLNKKPCETCACVVCDCHVAGRPIVICPVIGNVGCPGAKFEICPGFTECPAAEKVK